MDSFPFIKEFFGQDQESKKERGELTTIPKRSLSKIVYNIFFKKATLKLAGDELGPRK
jgi:hypothetical protein